MRLEFSVAAEEDLIQIYLYGAVNFGTDQAERYYADLQKTFDMLVAHPRLAREHREFTPPVRIHFHKNHVIIYAVHTERLFVLRVLGDQQDWQAIISGN
jgi:toxin ParE1/3/4